MSRSPPPSNFTIQSLLSNRLSNRTTLSSSNRTASSTRATKNKSKTPTTTNSTSKSGTSNSLLQPTQSKLNKTVVNNLTTHFRKYAIPLKLVEEIYHGKHGDVKVLGSGASGSAVLVSISNKEVAAKVGARKIIMKLFKNGAAKSHEELVHHKVYYRLRKARKFKCLRHLCKPIKSEHPLISIQHAASQNNSPVVTVEDKMFNVNGYVRHVGKDERWAIAQQIASALSCIHHVGCMHSDVKFDNMILVQLPSNRDGFTLKLIDFGLAMCSRNGQSIVLPKNLNSNAKGIQTLRQLISELGLRNNGGGTFTNETVIKPKAANATLRRPKQILENMELLSTNTPALYRKALTKLHLNNAMKKKLLADSFARKWITQKKP